MASSNKLEFHLMKKFSFLGTWVFQIADCYLVFFKEIWVITVNFSVMLLLTLGDNVFRTSNLFW